MTRLSRLARSMATVASLLTLTGCVTTMKTSSEIERLICETADFYRFKPYRDTWNKLTIEEQRTLKRQLDAFRREDCPRILKRNSNT